jgi:Acetyltransferase (GNAT) domain
LDWEIPLNSKYSSLSVGTSVLEAEDFESMPESAAAAQTQVRTLTTVAELEELRPLWNDWKGHPHSEIDFLRMLIESREEIVRPHVIVVYRGGKPDAMLVGRLERSQIDFEIGYLKFWKAHPLSLAFQYGALRGNPSDENCKEIVLSILKSLKCGDADLATLSYPSIDSCLSKMALSLPGSLSRDSAAVPQAHHRLRLPATLDEVFQGFSNSHRRSVKSHAKQIEKKLNGRLNIRCFRALDELEEGISVLEEVARKTYHRGLGVGFEDTSRSRQMLQFYARRGQLRMYVLFDADKPITFWAGISHDGWFHLEHTGFDPEYRDCSPGTYLFVKMIECFCAEGMQGIDFGLGDAVYKERFGNESFEEAVVEIYAPRPKGIMIKLFRSLETGVSSTVKKALARTDFLTKLKKRWRDQLAKKGATE